MLRADYICLLGKESPEEEIAATIDFVKQSPALSTQLLAYLPQQHPIYHGRSANEVIRIRGYLFESFMHTGLAESALPYVLEVLETGRQAYVVAGAAIALRGLPSPRPQLVPYLLKAVSNMKLVDDAVSFESYKPRWPLTNHSTALLEICKSLQWIGPAATASIVHLKELCRDPFLSDNVKSEINKAITIIEEGEKKRSPGCCDLPVRSKRDRLQTRKRLDEGVADLVLEDQNGQTIKYREYFSGRPTVVVFFYTRCDNPNKCSLTITRLGQLQKALIAAGLEGKIKTAAITYDPVYDRPFRLQSYCHNRGMLLNDDHRVFRIESGMPVMLGYFDSGVNYIGSIVNQHAIELFILDQDGQIANRFQQLPWDVPEVIDQLKKQLRNNRQGQAFSQSSRNSIRDFASFLLSVSILFFPKCPLCLASYLSVLGITNIQILQFTPWLLPALFVLLVINLFSLFKGANKRNGLLPFLLSLSGTLFIFFFGLLLNIPILGYVGTALILSGSALNSLDQYAFSWMRLRDQTAGSITFR
jgi:protein SCO1/2